MLEKILKTFFVKSQPKKASEVLTIKRKIENYLELEKRIDKIKTENKKVVETSLSSYFAAHRGLNLFERGYTYSKFNEYNR